MKEILLGDEAVSRGAIDAGLSCAYAYPGTPSTEIFESLTAYVKEHQLPIQGLWSTNEKVALEEAVGVSYCGKRALVSMKHVGLNVAADPFMNVAVSGAHGGLVLAVADDPSMHSSQNEQDSRVYADFAQVPCFEPADQQQAYELTREAFEVSEKFKVPVLMRLVTRLAHSRALVELGTRRPQNEQRFVPDYARFTLMPANARKAYGTLVEVQAQLQAYANETRFNELTIRGQGKPGIIVTGIAYNYLAEALGPKLADYNVLRLSVYPLPVAKVRTLLDASTELTIVEEGYPFIERFVSALGLFREKPIKGRLTGALPRMGELSPDVLRTTFGLPTQPSLKVEGVEAILKGRPPRLCDGCPHGDSYEVINAALKEIGHETRVMGDIGCYTLGYLKPHSAIHSCLCMGSSIGMAIGASHAGVNPAMCVIGDGTFTHSGMTALLDAVNANANIKVVILDNSIVAMTGGQPTAATDEQVVELVAGLGVDRKHIKIIKPVPLQRAANLEVVKAEIAYQGLSVIVARRACVRYAKEIKANAKEREEHHHVHDPDCANCNGSCR